MRMHLDNGVERRPIKDRSAVTFDLDFPPSANNMFANVKHGRIQTDAYKEWATRCGWLLLIAKPGRMPGAVHIGLEYEEKPGRRRDLDNLIKPVLDLIVKHAVIDGDHSTVVRAINAKWGPVTGVRVTIESAFAMPARAA